LRIIPDKLQAASKRRLKQVDVYYWETFSHCGRLRSNTKATAQGNRFCIEWKEPVTIYATADTDHYIPIRNLSTTHKHYTTDTDLCSTAQDTCRTYCNLSTTIDPSLTAYRESLSGTPGSLSSTVMNLFRPHDNSWAAVQPYKTHNHLPADCCRTFQPGNNLWPTGTEPDFRPGTDLGSTVTNPLHYIVWR
jgi:hypothetical protein